MKHGDYQVDLVEAGRLGLDGGAMFGIVPRPLWERHAPPDDRNRIRLAMRCLLLRGNGRTVLVDTGMGHKADATFREIYAVDHGHSALVPSLAALGVAPADVTDVLLTHLHFDHGGGTTERDEGDGPPGALRLVFPEAAHHVQRRHWEWAHASTREAASFLPENLDPLAASGRLVLHDGPGEVLPGIETVVVDGHTRGQQLPLLHGPEGTLFYPADLVPTAAHVPLLWGMAYDIEPLKTIEEKTRLLTRAADEGWTLVFEHDPAVAAVRVEATAKGMRAVDRQDGLPA